MQWNELTKTENPTKSIVLNEMIKKVVKHEVGKQGAPSKARRALQDAEFRDMVNKLQ